MTESNGLSDIIPTAENFSLLKIMLLSGTDNILSEIQRLKEIFQIDFSTNNRIPPDIGNCLSMTHLDLSQNQLTASIPVQIAETHQITFSEALKPKPSKRNWVNQEPKISRFIAQ